MLMMLLFSQRLLRNTVSMAGYYRKFIKDFARKTHYMLELCCKGVRWEWDEKHQVEFENLKKDLTLDPVMAYPDWKEDK
jgi:hypothetical protein